MNRDIVSLLKCPACDKPSLVLEIFHEGIDDYILEGILHCTACLNWYPIEDDLLELLVGDLAYPVDRSRFWESHVAQLRSLGLKRDAHTFESTGHQLQRQQQQHFDWYSGNVQQTYSSYEQSPFWTAADKIAFASWNHEIQPNKWLIDVGCAQGRSTFKMMNFDINIIGFDISKHLVYQAIRRYHQKPYRAKATFIAADASRFPIVAASIDYVLIYGVLHHLPDLGRTCEEIARVLKPGGIYFGSENNTTIFRIGFDLLQKINPIWYEEAGPEALISSHRLHEAFANTGVHIETSTYVFLPPHLINLLPSEIGYQLLSFADRLGTAVPILRQNGGLILIRGIKS